jgi:hypothetical protein
MSKSPPTAPVDGDNHSSSAQTPYAVGYGRPPEHTRFKPGQSGNRRGRPKRQRNVRTVVEETLNQRIKIREGNGTRSLTKLDGVILTMINGALKGEPKALAALISLVRSLGMTGSAPEATNLEPLTDNDDVLLADYLGRRDAASTSHDPQDGGAATPGTAAPATGAKS